MKQKTKTLPKTESILQNIDLKVKLEETHNNARYPKSQSKRRFTEIFFLYVKGALERYHYTANTLFDKKKDKDFFYNAVKNKNYDFSNILKNSSYKLLDEYLEKHKSHTDYDSWASRNYITIVIDKMECERTTDNFEKSKKLHKAEHGHYLINLCFVIGDDKEIYPLNTVLYDPDCGKTSIDIAVKMVKDCLQRIKNSKIDMNRVRFTADREFLNHKILDIFYTDDFKKCKCVMAAKCNTVIYNKHGYKTNVDELKYKLFKDYTDDFKYSVQLDTWTAKHGRPRYKYYTLIRDTNFGKVRIVAVVNTNIKLTEENYKQNIKILINPNANMTSVQMLVTYRGHRWHIEVFHKDLKQNIEIVRSYRGLSFIGIKNHYILRILAYLALVRYRSLKHSWKLTVGRIKQRIVMRM